MSHCWYDAAERLLDQEFHVLDKGFVKLIDYMGGDSRIAQSARISTGGMNKTPEEDAKLICYLMKNQHSSPFESVRFTFHVKAPLFVIQQVYRHRTATYSSYNQYSGRYSEMLDEFYIPEPAEIKGQGKMNKQGSEGILPATTIETFRTHVGKVSKMAYDEYQNALKAGVSREDARILLPINQYSQYYWTVDLWNLFHFLSLRNDVHTQHQTREYARAVEGIVETVVPVAYAAWVNSK